LTAKSADNYQGEFRKIMEHEFAGKWKIIEALDMVEDYLSLSPDPHLMLQVDEKNKVTGSYQFGSQDGYIDGLIEHDNENLKLIFSFEGWDEADLVNGSGTFCIESGETYLLTMNYENGKIFCFRCQAIHGDLDATGDGAA